MAVGSQQGPKQEAPTSIVQKAGDRVIQIGQVFGNVFLGSGARDEQRAQRNRRAMLELVKNSWIQGVLEQSLHGAAMLELGMEERADAVERPWDTVLRTHEWGSHHLRPGVKMVTIFDGVGRTLLVLGEPGSGKTTMLLELARDLIARAEQDESQPMPVVFNLSTWAEKQQPIADWLVDELNSKYHIPKRIAAHWVENDELTLLLDGLDEVTLNRREACVKAINDFRQQHMVPLVVCSRTADYEVLVARLKLQGAVVLQPLSPEQIDTYLTGAGTELLAVRKTLKYDTVLQELAQSPLMLSIMKLAYWGMPVEDLQPLDTIETRRRHVFNAYLARMFGRSTRVQAEHYPKQQTVRGLSWLAQRMSEHSLSVFLIEELQPSWLSSRLERLTYLMSTRLVIGLIIGCAILVLGPFVPSLTLATWVLPVGLQVGVVGGLIATLFSGLCMWRHQGGIEGEPSSTRRLLEVAIGFAVIALIAGLGAGLLMLLHISPGVISPLASLRSAVNPLLGLAVTAYIATIRAFVLVQAILIGASFGMLFGVRTPGCDPRRDIQTIEAVKWSWKRALRGIIGGFIAGLFVGLIGGAILVGVFYVPFRETIVLLLEILETETPEMLEEVSPEWLAQQRKSVGAIQHIPRGVWMLCGGGLTGLLCSWPFAYVGGLLGGLSGRMVEMKMVTNQGIKQSARNTLLGGVIVALGGVLISFIVAPLFRGEVFEVFEVFGAQVPNRIITLLRWGLAFGVVGGLWYGGMSVIQHYVLRFLLCLNGQAPLNFKHFLNCAAERIFLRKVGGGYIFTHRLLMEYFAELDQERIDTLGSELQAHTQ